MFIEFARFAIERRAKKDDAIVNFALGLDPAAVPGGKALYTAA